MPGVHGPPSIRLLIAKHDKEIGPTVSAQLVRVQFCCQSADKRNFDFVEHPGKSSSVGAGDLSAVVVCWSQQNLDITYMYCLFMSVYIHLIMDFLFNERLCLLSYVLKILKILLLVFLF